MDIATLDRSIEDIDIMCRIVRAAPPERFDMEKWSQESACGTAACIAGWSAIDPVMRARCGMAGHAALGLLGIGSDAREVVCRSIPALRGVNGYEAPCFWGDITAKEPQWFLFDECGAFRGSRVDDAPFDATPAEIACLGADYARGLAEREAALNRLAIVRACLVKWRAALTPQVHKPALVAVEV